MNMSIEDSFKKDLLWLLSELKQEEMANAYSEYKINFPLEKSSDDEPTLRSQSRLLKMLEDRKALTLKPFFHRTMSLLDSALQMQGAKPMGFYIQILQPQFDEILEEVTKQKPTPITSRKTEEKTDPPARSNKDVYFVSLSNDRKVLLNNTLILASPNFDTENHRFIEYILEHPDEKLKKADLEKGAKSSFRKNFHSTVSNLGFKGELKKLFFQTSKATVLFRNYVPKTELYKLGIDIDKLNTELSGLERIDKEDEETIRSKAK